jgi:hypothetical protein
VNVRKSIATCVMLYVVVLVLVICGILNLNPPIQYFLKLEHDLLLLHAFYLSACPNNPPSRLETMDRLSAHFSIGEEGSHNPFCRCLFCFQALNS